MSATMHSFQVAGTVEDIERLPAGSDPDQIFRAWACAVEAASELFKAEHPGWFVC